MNIRTVDRTNSHERPLIKERFSIGVLRIYFKGIPKKERMRKLLYVTKSGRIVPVRLGPLLVVLAYLMLIFCGGFSIWKYLLLASVYL